MRLGWNNENLEPKVLRLTGKVFQDLPQIVANPPFSTINAYSYDTNIQAGPVFDGGFHLQKTAHHEHAIFDSAIK
jgi:hypothetical protein